MTVTTEPLVELGRQLGLDGDALQVVEHVDRLAGTFDVRSAAVAALTTDVVAAFAEAYGAAARFTIGTGDLVEFIAERGQFDQYSLQRLTAEAGQVDTTYRVVIAIEKERLAAELAAGSTNAVVRVFFFRDALARHLGHAPSLVEQELWRDAGKRLVVALLDGAPHLSGACLSVVPGDPVAVATEAAKPIPGGLDRMATRRNDYIGWDNVLSTRLTPMHFERPDGDIAELDERVDALAVGLASMYLCDRARDVHRPDGRTYTQVEFRGREHIAFIPVNWEGPSLSGVTARHVDAVLEVVAWCYEAIPEHRGTDMVADRLPFVQTRVSQLLESRPEAERLAGFAVVMPSIAEGVKWYWRSFIEGRVSEYLDHVRELETAIGEVVGKLAEQTAGLVKRLTETSLAAVAALIGSFIAATFKDPFQDELFRIAMLAYAAYVLVFPFAIGVTSSIGDARLSFSGFELQRRALDDVLGQERVEEIVGDRPARARDRFRFWAWTVGVLYVIAVVAAVVAALAIPDVVDDPGSSSVPTSSSTKANPDVSTP